MENASKALIIAGAILLAIIIISMGILVVNQGRSTASEANLDQETIQAFNTKLSQYCGAGKTGTTMNSLMDAISSSNGSQRGKSSTHYISFDTSGCATGATLKQKVTVTGGGAVNYPSFDNSRTYTATYTTGADGYINLVTIK